jgi:ferric-dicitrate binding protein FerR (iron transport regulator)
LEGEGYFKVAKNKVLPFIVDALGFKVKAVGTEFNVKAYKNEGTVETTLVEGKVELITASQKNSESVYMEPNQKAIYVKDHQKLDIEELKREKPNMAEIAPVNKEADLLMTPPINIQSQVSWVNDRLIVEREPLSELAVRLSRKYNFTFVFKSEDIKRYRFSGTLEDETLQQVMDVIKLTSPIDYEISGKTVVIDKNENRQKKFEPYLKN